VCNYYISSLLENLIPLHIQNYIIIILSILLQIDNIELLKELKDKTIETDKYIRIIGDKALEIQDNEINIYKLNETIRLKNKIKKRKSFS
jgi:hypothetical protein